MITGITQPMVECKNCIICGEYIGLGNDPAVCSDDCLNLYKAECSHDKLAEEDYHEQIQTQEEKSDRKWNQPRSQKRKHVAESFK